MEPKVKRFPWPKDFETNPKDYIDGMSGIAKGKVDKVKDNIDRVIAILEDSVNTLDGVLEDMERLIRRIESKKNKVQ